MIFFLQFLGCRVTKAITKEFIEPHNDEDTQSEAIAKDYEANANAQHALTQALNDDDLSHIINSHLRYGKT